MGLNLLLTITPVFLVIIPYFIFLIAALLDLSRRTEIGTGLKIVWALIIFLLGPFLGAGILIYLFVYKKFRLAVGMIIYYILILCVIIGLVFLSQQLLKKENAAIQSSAKNEGINSNVTKSPKAPDSDNDGLSDAEEMVYRTDARNLDTDGDGFTDREEINSGNNPLGPGKLAAADNTIPKKWSTYYYNNFSIDYPSDWIANEETQGLYYIVAEIYKSDPKQFSVLIKALPKNKDQSLLNYINEEFIDGDLAANKNSYMEVRDDESLITPKLVATKNYTGYQSYLSFQKNLRYFFESPNHEIVYSIFLSPVNLDDPIIKMTDKMIESIWFGGN